MADPVPDGPCWTYLLDLDTDILEIYEPRCGLNFETESILGENVSLATRGSPAYYCKIHLSELQAMWRKDWITRHRVHAEELARVWKESIEKSLKGTCKKTLSFRDLYDATFSNRPEDGTRRRYPTRNTRANVGRATASKSNTQPSCCGSRAREAGACDSTFIHKRGLREGTIVKRPSSRRHCRPVNVSLARGAECWAVRRGWFDKK